jgi:LPXTG-motif cell wall-anchored protein
MKIRSSIPGLIARILTYALVATAFSVGVLAQDVTNETVRHGTPSYQTEVKNAKVVYVEGNDLVLKLENGRVEHMIVPDTDEFLISGKKLSVRELKPGTTLTQLITTSTTPRYVKTVRVLKGKVWHVMAPHSVIVSLPDGSNHRYSVPSHAKFIVNGEEKTVFDLRKGMSFQATIVTDEPQTVLASSKTTFGRAPAPATPPLYGVLLIQPVQATAATPSVSEAQPPITVASVELPSELPKTGSALPWLAVLGALATAMGMTLATLRRKLTA